MSRPRRPFEPRGSTPSDGPSHGAHRSSRSRCPAPARAELQQSRGDAGSGVRGRAATAPGAHPCDIDLQVRPDGPVLRILQALGSGSRGCRMEPGAVEAAAAEAARHLDGAAVLIVNKFGKLEAAGHGFVPLIAAALDRGPPVLTGVNGPNLAAFEAFAGGARPAASSRCGRGAGPARGSGPGPRRTVRPVLTAAGLAPASRPAQGAACAFWKTS
ncbi:hypothetical protein DSD19_14215 [Rhodovulum sp. BSW8]|nr:hypothetical protein DSD19_14215 [Rhodovulum sp. BSW8]